MTIINNNDIKKDIKFVLNNQKRIGLLNIKIIKNDLKKGKFDKKEKKNYIQSMNRFQYRINKIDVVLKNIDKAI